LHEFKNKNLEANEIINFDEKIKNFVKDVKNSEYFEQYFDNYLNIKGYAYRLENKSQRLFYTFQEAVYAIDLAKLMRDDDALLLNSIVYILVISDCIDEYLEKEIDESLKEKAIIYYKNEETKRADENKKYHMYQN